MEAGMIVIVGCAAAYVAAQAIKNLADLIKGEWSTSKIFSNGGMPSSHTATISSLVAGVFFAEGLSTNLAISIALLAVVIADALGVRRAVGDLALSMNRFHHTQHNVAQGHTILEILAGLALGLVFGTAMWIFLS